MKKVFQFIVFCLVAVFFFGCSGNEKPLENFEIYKNYSACNVAAYLVLSENSENEKTKEHYSNGGFIVENISNVYNYNGNDYTIYKVLTDIDNPNLRNEKYVEKFDNGFLIDKKEISLENENCSIFRVESYVKFDNQPLEKRIHFLNWYFNHNDFYFYFGITGKAKIDLIIWGLDENLVHYNLEMQFDENYPY